MLRIECVWLFPLCLVPNYRGQQSDDLGALETEVLLMTKITFFLKKVALSKCVKVSVIFQKQCVLEESGTRGSGGTWD